MRDPREIWNNLVSFNPTFADEKFAGQYYKVASLCKALKEDEEVIFAMLSRQIAAQSKNYSAIKAIIADSTEESFYCELFVDINNLNYFHPDNAIAVFFTNQRILMGRNDENYRILHYDEIVSVSSKRVVGSFKGEQYVLFECKKDKYNMHFFEFKIFKKYFDTINEIVKNAKYSNFSTNNQTQVQEQPQSQPQVQPQPTETVSVTEEIKKFKELLDMGAITQEEYDIKKKQLLGL